MIDDRRTPRLERFERTELGRPLQHLEIERRVEPPPDLFEHVEKRRRCAGRSGHPSREGRIQVVVGADEPRSRAGVVATLVTAPPSADCSECATRPRRLGGSRLCLGLLLVGVPPPDGRDDHCTDDRADQTARLERQAVAADQAEQQTHRRTSRRGRRRSRWSSRSRPPSRPRMNCAIAPTRIPKPRIARMSTGARYRGDYISKRDVMGTYPTSK